MRSPRQKTTDTTSLWVAFALTVAACLWFLWPAWQRTRPHAPFPLDDVYIHLDYARSFRLLEPFAWLPGQGYSSGETAPLYALVLAVPARLGLDGDALALTATLLALGCVGYGLHQLGALAGLHPWLGRLAPWVCLGFGVVTWSLLSGMELALYFAVFARLLREQQRGARLTSSALLLALLVALRPEALLLALVLGAGLVRDRVAARPLRRVAAYLRLVLPAVSLQLGVFAANRLATGETQSAGAILKLVSENPTLDDPARMREVLTNLVTAWFGAFSRSTVAPTLTAVVLAMAVALALWPRRGRGTALALLCATPALALLVSLNATARYQGFRYYVPAFLCLLALVLRGIFTLAARSPRLATATTLLLFGLTAPKLPTFRTHFARAAGNIAEQQVQVGLRLARDTPADARILVGDAGAIPYFSHRSAIDALGLGGFHGMGFVRAATHGEAATLELLERLSPERRPTHLALYASWFPGLVRGFGHEWFSVTLDDNVICGAPTKTVYHADWLALGEHVPERLVPVGEPTRLLDELDFADLESERAHDFGGTAFLPTAVEIRHEDESVHFDGCRRLGPDQEAFFTLHTPGNTHLRTRATRIGVRGLDLASARFSLTPAADGRPFAGRFELGPDLPKSWQLGTTWFAPARPSTTFTMRVLASDRGALLCHLWWINTE